MQISMFIYVTLHFLYSDDIITHILTLHLFAIHVLSTWNWLTLHIRIIIKRDIHTRSEVKRKRKCLHNQQKGCCSFLTTTYYTCTNTKFEQINMRCSYASLVFWVLFEDEGIFFDGISNVDKFWWIYVCFFVQDFLSF